MNSDTPRPPWANLIQDYLAQHPTAPRRPRHLARAMGVDQRDYAEFRRVVKELKRAGALGPAGPKGGQTSRGGTQAARLRGRFQATPRGFGFVAPEGSPPADDVYIPLAATAGALHGDLVMVQLTPHRHGRQRPTGKIVEIVERRLRRLVGTIERVEGAWFLEPDGKQLNQPLLLDHPFADELQPGRKAVADIVDYPPGPGMLATGVIHRFLGPAGDLAVETEAIVLAHDLPQEFSAEALAEAARIVQEEGSVEQEGKTRRDVRQLTVVTIDPAEARDFDDAISIEQNEQGQDVLGVHIADVAHFVRPGSALDGEARQRGTSVYFPRHVLPMLPPGLSQGVCALRPGVPRLAVTVFVTYDEAGRVLDRRVESTIIQSCQRLTYEEAQALCDGAAGPWAAPVVELVQTMKRLAQRIERRRSQEGMLQLDLPEIDLTLNDQGQVVGAQPRRQDYSHRIIEMFMVEANEAVAHLLTEEKVPVIRRVHPPPETKGFAPLTKIAAAWGRQLPARHISRRDLQQLVRAVQGQPGGYAINLTLLRALQRARYSTEEAAHYALGSGNYCHFTSPIRRFPDLLVHRLVKQKLLSEADGGSAPPRAELQAAAHHCSETERRAEAAEAELRQVLVLQHIATLRGPDRTFTGVVTAVAEYGLFVQSPRFLIEGLLRREALGHDWWVAAPASGILSGMESGVTFRVGELVEVTITGVDVARRHLDLKLATPVEGRLSRRERRGGRPPRRHRSLAERSRHRRG